MAYKILTSNPVLDTHDFFVDTAAELAELPIEPASMALVATTGDIYICTNAGTWTLFSKGVGETTEGE